MRNGRDMQQRTRRQAGVRRRAFTLLELLLSLFLIIVIMAMVFRFYSSAMETRERGREVAHEVMLMRAILEGIADDIRQTVDQVPGDERGFAGTEETITIVRTRLPEAYAFQIHESMREELPPMQKDLERIRYELIYDEENLDEHNNPIIHGLWRSVQKRFDPNPRFAVVDEETGEQVDTPEGTVPMIEGELIAPEVKYLKFEFYDGVEWRDRWQVAYEGMVPGGEGEEAVDEYEEGENVEMPAVSQAGIGGVGYALPQAVRVTIGLIPEDPEKRDFDVSVLQDRRREEEELEHHGDRYTIVVNLRMADPSLLSSRKHGLENQPDLQLGGR